MDQKMRRSMSKKAACAIRGISARSNRDPIKEAIAYLPYASLLILMVHQSLVGQDRTLFLLGMSCAIALGILLRMKRHTYLYGYTESPINKIINMDEQKVVPIRDNVSIPIKKDTTDDIEKEKLESRKQHILISLDLVRDRVQDGKVKSLAILWEDTELKQFCTNMSADNFTVLIAMFEMAKTKVIQDADTDSKPLI